MVRNKAKYEQAVQFRKRGFTLEEIAKICEVSKSTVSKWLKNKDFSVAVTKENKRRSGRENAKRLQLIHKARASERSTRYKEAERSARVEYKHYKDNPLFIAGLMLYLTQGDLKDLSRIRLSSTQLQVHKLFIRFAIDYLGVEKKQIHCWLQLYQGQSEETCLKKWKTTTTLPFSQFYKSQYIHNRKPTGPLHFGVGNTIIGNTVLKRKLILWIELTQKNLAK